MSTGPRQFWLEFVHTADLDVTAVVSNLYTLCSCTLHARAAFNLGGQSVWTSAGVFQTQSKSPQFMRLRAFCVHAMHAPSSDDQLARLLVSARPKSHRQLYTRCSCVLYERTAFDLSGQSVSISTGVFLTQSTSPSRHMHS